MSRALAAAALALLACGDDSAATIDAGADAATGDAGTDAAPSGRLAVVLEGETLAYADEEVCFTAIHDGGPGARHTWIWSDDTRDVIDGETRACHTYAFPGEFLTSVVVEARGMTADATLLLTVVPRPSAVPPTRSASIAYDPVRDRVWVVNPDADSVAVLDARAPALVREIPVGDRPRTLAWGGDAVAVACQESAELRLIDAETLEARSVVTLPTGSEPYGVAADPRGGAFWVSLLATGEVVRVDAARSEVSGTIDVGPDPRGLALNADGVLLVTRFRSDEAGARVVTVDASDPAAPAVVGTTVLPPDVGRDADTDNDGVLNLLNHVLFSPDGGRAVIPGLKANIVAGAFRVGRDLTSQTTARAVLGEVMVGAPGEVAVESFRLSFDDLDFASAVAFSPEGSRLYVAFQGAESIQQLDAFSFNVTGSIDEVGHAPQGLVVSPGGGRLFVQAFLSRSVRVYDVGDLSMEPSLVSEIPTVATEPLAADVLRGKIVFYRSRDPRMSRTSYLSCASCHLDGEADGLVWDFTQRGEGLRNTIPLRGRAGLGHGALHWTANFDEVQDFEHDIRGGQGGAGFLPDAVFHTGTRDTTLGDPKAGLDPDLDALAAYVTSLSGFGVSPFRRDGDAAWEASFARGEAVFSSAGCAPCHAGSAFTDSGFVAPAMARLHDVGTQGPGSGGRLGGALPGLDTPTLRGLWRSAPYLHDGSAPTLRDVLTTRNPTDTHGTTSTLGTTTIDDLITYLLALDDRVP